MKRSSSTSTAQKAFRKSSSLNPETVEYLKNWMMSPEHIAHPYPTEQEKAEIMAETGIEIKQLTNWFVNNRKRFWKPRVEAKLQKSTASSSTGAASLQPLPSQHNSRGLSISSRHTGPPVRQQQSSSFPKLPNHNVRYPQGSNVRSSSNNSFGNGPAYIEDDRHTISEGSSASLSDDDSTSYRPTTFGAVARQYLASLSKDNSSASASAVPVSGGYRRYEEVDVLVLRPEPSSDSSEEPLPTLRDLTIKTSVPKERILATFKCPISYTVPYEIEHDRRKVQSRRDGEVLRIKKHYLKLYLATRGIHSASSPMGSGTHAVPPSSASSVSSAPDTNAVIAVNSYAVSPLIDTSAQEASTSSRTRAVTCTDIGQDEYNMKPAPRKRARTSSGSFLKGEEEWRELCKSAKSFYCDDLPSLEEATTMFGYAPVE